MSGGQSPSPPPPPPPPPRQNGEGPWKTHAKKPNGEGPWTVTPLLPIPPHVPHALSDDQQHALALLEARHAVGFANLLKASYDELLAILERGD